jgi:hypothetical protein
LGDGGFGFTLLLDKKGEKSVFIHTFFLTKKYAKTQDQTMLLPTGFYAGPPFGRAVAWVFIMLGFTFLLDQIRRRKDDR